MPRGQDLLGEAIALTQKAAPADDSGRATDLAGRMEAQLDKFFFKSLAGVPLANKAKKAAEALGPDCSAASLDTLEDIISQIEDKADAPGTVIT